MSKSIKLQDDTFLDSTGVVHKKELLSKVLEDMKTSIENIDIPDSKDPYPVGTIYINDSETNPNETLGYGTWEKVRTLYGGELIAYACVMAVGGASITKNIDVGFGGEHTGTKEHYITNYIDGILSAGNGAIKVQTKGIVGMVEANVTLSGLGASGTVGVWFKDNNNALPSNVELYPFSTSNAIIGGINGANFGGVTHNYHYKVKNTEDTTFYVNPKFSPYNGNFQPSISGTKSYLLVKAYARYGTSYMWKRTA